MEVLVSCDEVCAIKMLFGLSLLALNNCADDQGVWVCRWMRGERGCRPASLRAFLQELPDQGTSSISITVRDPARKGCATALGLT